MTARFLLVALAVCALVAPPARAAAPAEPDISFEKTVAPLLKNYCYDCHGDGEHKGDVALDHYKNTAAVEQDRKTWELVLHNVRSQIMPPDDVTTQPTAVER